MHFYYISLYDARKQTPPITEAPSLGDVINKSRPGRESEEERICFVTGGLPVWDVGWSYEIYQNALKLGLGQTLKLWDDPHLNETKTGTGFPRCRSFFE